MAEETIEEKILRIVLAKVDEDNISINRRFDSIMDSFRNQTKMIEGGIGLLKGEILDFRHDMKSKLGFIDADMKKMRTEMKTNHQEIKDLIKER